MTNERVEEISWELFHLDCEHEWRTKGEDTPVPRHACGDCVREALTTALAQAEQERDAETLRANTYLDKLKAARAEVERLKEQRDAVEDLRQMAAANATGQALRAERAEAALAHVRAGLTKLLAELSDVQLEAVREGCGNTNAACLRQRVDEARATLEGRG